MSHWALHHENIYSHPQYNLASPCSAILLSSKIAMSSLLYHKNVFKPTIQPYKPLYKSNAEITTNMQVWEPLHQTIVVQDQRKGIPPSRAHDVALVERATS